MNYRRYDGSECLVFEAADMISDMVFRDTSVGAFNENVLFNNGRNGNDVVPCLKVLAGIMN
jgi:hypothetical protein